MPHRFITDGRHVPGVSAMASTAVSHVGPVPGPNGLHTDALVFGGALLAVSLWLLRPHVGRWRSAYAMWSRDPIRAAAVASAGAGSDVEIAGSVAVLEETLEAEYTGRECVAYTYTEQERRGSSGCDSRGGTEWNTVDSGGERVPFLVRDDSGAVAVDPSGASLTVETDHEAGGQGTKRRESRLDPGDRVHVYGQKHTAVERVAGLDTRRHYVGGGDETPTFRITEGGETRAETRGWLQVVLGAVILLALSVVGLDFVVFGLGFDPVVFG